MFANAVAGVSFLVWIYLLAGRGDYWRAHAHAPAAARGEPASWPPVICVIPARDEVMSIGRTVAALLAQDYPGSLSIVLVDDQSSDGTAATARLAAEAAGHSGRLSIVNGAALPQGWTGKLWAVRQGIERATETSPDFLLLTDADIVLRPDVLRALVSSSLEENLVLASVMAKLRCESFAERALIPAFIYFFQMLYPFAWVNDRGHSTAAAAGGCMLVRRSALEAAGGIATIRNALIDDCALARVLKRQGKIRLALDERVSSIRAYQTFHEIRHMVVRCAFAQLRYSWLLLALALAGLTLVFVVPVVATLFGHGAARLSGLLAWAAMAFSFLPTLRFYGVSLLWAPLLPGIAVAYMAFTLDSAYQSLRGRGGLWKGRVQAQAADLS